MEGLAAKERTVPARLYKENRRIYILCILQRDIFYAGVPL